MRLQRINSGISMSFLSLRTACKRSANSTLMFDHLHVMTPIFKLKIFVTQASGLQRASERVADPDQKRASCCCFEMEHESRVMTRAMTLFMVWSHVRAVYVWMTRMA